VAKRIDSDVDEGFVDFVRRSREPLVRYGLRRLSTTDQVEELVAEAFATAWRRWGDQPSEADQQLFWLFAIARLVLLNQWRGRDRRVRLVERLRLQRVTDNSGEQSTLVDCLAEALEGLPDEDREAVEFAYWENLSYREIGQVMGCSDNAVELRLRRARKALRIAITESKLQNSKGEVMGQ
jgi:RNA polymerase sigma-70 factor (ECF subfamily)